MKRHSEAVSKIASAELKAKSAEIRKDLADLTRGVRMGDVQNYKLINVKKKELARVLTRMASEDKGGQK